MVVAPQTYLLCVLRSKGRQKDGVDISVGLQWAEVFVHLPVALQEQKFCQRYDQLMEAWEKKVERIENNPRRRAKESKVREYYEKQFPEIRKQRELQERMQR